MKHTGLTGLTEEIATFGNLQEHAALIKRETREERNSNRRNACNISR